MDKRYKQDEVRKRISALFIKNPTASSMARPPGANMKNIARGSAGIIKPPEIK
jgi:hypothetical protein